MTVLVTGSTGRVGSTLVRRLLDEGWQVRAMARRHGRRIHESLARDVEIVEADLRDQASLTAACEDVTHVVHLAARLMRNETPIDDFFDINALGTLRLLEGVAKCGTVKRFVLVSTDGVYRPGQPPSIPLTEDSPAIPADYYGTSKLLAEIILRNQAVQYAVPYSIVRLATVVSPEESLGMFRLSFWRSFVSWQNLGKESHLWPLFDKQNDLSRVLSNATHGAKDDVAVGFQGPLGDPWTLSLVDVRDAAEGIYRALVEPNAIDRVFNISSAEPTSHDSAASTVSEAFDVRKYMVRMPMSHNLELSIEAAREFLGYEPKRNYSDILYAGLSGDAPGYINAHSATGVAEIAAKN